MSQTNQQVYEFGRFRLEVANRRLLREGEPVPLAPKAFDVLVVLVTHHGELLDKDKLMQMLWPDRFVEEANLPQNISALRKALGESPNQRKYIVTIPGKGYKFAAEVKILQCAEEVVVLERHAKAMITVQEQEGDEEKAIRSEQGPSQPCQLDTGSSDHVVNRAVLQRRISFPVSLKILVGLITASALVFLTYGLWARRAATPDQKQSRTIAVPIESIAVLPFVNAGADPEMEYLSDGLSEDLINSLSQLPQLKVIARSSSFKYKGRDANPQEIAGELGVQAILTGRIVQRGDSLMVSVELVEARDRTQIWGAQYTRKSSDIFVVQDEIARQITDTLRVRLTSLQQKQVTKHYTENPEAHLLYLQGRYYFNQYSEENIKRAIPFFDRAIALDPHYALAYAARGESYAEMEDFNLTMSEAVLKARLDSATALSMDDELVEARTTQARIKFHFDWDFAGAEEDFKRAIALSPSYGEAHRQYGWYLSMLGRTTEGVAEMKLAQQLDPINPHINVDVFLPYYLGRQYDQASAQSRKTLELFPNFYLGHMTLGNALFQKGDYLAGIEELQKAEAIESTPTPISMLGYAYAKAGRKDEALKLLAELKDLSKQRRVAPYLIAMVYVGLDQKDEAFAWFEKAYQERSWMLLWLKTSPDLDSLRSDPRFTRLLRRVNLTP